MATINFIAQPLLRSTLDAIDDALTVPDIDSIDTAAAYITSSGMKLLLKTMRARDVDGQRVKKRWVTSFDYCRTEPGALETLLGMPSSTVRIHDAKNCLVQRGMPTVPFHPKMFLFRSRHAHQAVAGSGNLTRSGLTRGFEAGLTIRAKVPTGPDVSPAVGSLQSLHDFFDHVWKRAAPLTPGLLHDYRGLFESAEHLRNPVPTEDDTAPPYVSRGALTGEDLKKLRVCRHFWIEAGKVTKNRGPKLPGNQLMMKRLSRVFFGFEPVAVPENSKIGDVEISYQDETVGCSLTYSDNTMDKLVLPIPGVGGPAAYDDECLKFERTAPDGFRLSLASGADHAAWLKKSQRIDGAFEMSGGRKWGVF